MNTELEAEGCAQTAHGLKVHTARMAQELMLVQVLILSFAHKELHCLDSEKESDTRTVTQKTGGANPRRWALAAALAAPLSSQLIFSKT